MSQIFDLEGQGCGGWFFLSRFLLPTNKKDRFNVKG